MWRDPGYLLKGPDSIPNVNLGCEGEGSRSQAGKQSWVSRDGETGSSVFEGR